MYSALSPRKRHCVRESRQRRNWECVLTRSSGQARTSRHVAGDPSKRMVRSRRHGEEGLQTGLPGLGGGRKPREDHQVIVEWEQAAEFS